MTRVRALAAKITRGCLALAEFTMEATAAAAVTVLVGRALGVGV
jgi:hypothetical protein